MKKIILSVALLLVGFCASAQIVTDAGTFTKPVKGTTIMEAVFTPNIVGDQIFSLPVLSSDLGMVGLKARRFTSDNRAYRITANVSVSDTDKENSNSKTQYAIGLAYGLEYHLKGAERLSTYWGWDANVGMTATNVGTNGQTKRFGYGAALFTGADYYIIPKVYLGAEMSWGADVVHTDPAVGKNYTSCRVTPGITPSLRIGWQF